MKKLIALLPFIIATDVLAEDTIPTKQAKENGIETCIGAVETI